MFREVTTSDKVKDVARSLEGNIKDPRVLQTMIICKQPRIGGVGESAADTLLDVVIAAGGRAEQVQLDCP